MKKRKQIKKSLTVKWIVVNKKIVKFIEEEDKTYKLADNVIEYLEEIKSNVPVNVTIVGDSVIFIQKREGAVNEEPEDVTDTKPENNDETINNTYTVKAISKTRDYYLFEECGEKEWFTVASNVKNFLKDVKKGDVIEANVEVSNDGKRDTRTITYAKVNSVQKEEPKKETGSAKKKSSYRDEDSVDKRTAVMTAKDIVICLIQEKSLETKKIKEALLDLTKTCYEAIQSL